MTGLRGERLVAGYRRGDAVVDGVDIELRRGEVLGVAGPSGCGKSTLVKVLALLHEPWSGAVLVDGEQILGARYQVSQRHRTRIGVVFQQPRRSVDPRLTLHELVTEPLLAVGKETALVSTAESVAEMVARVGLTGELLTRRPHEVSEGQLQRACLARAMILGPRYLLCDEMTAMLDASTTASLVRVVLDYVTDTGAGALAVSHDEPLLSVWADRICRPWAQSCRRQPPLAMG